MRSGVVLQARFAPPNLGLPNSRCFLDNRVHGLFWLGQLVTDVKHGGRKGEVTWYELVQPSAGRSGMYFLSDQTDSVSISVVLCVVSCCVNRPSCMLIMSCPRTQLDFF